MHEDPEVTKNNKNNTNTININVSNGNDGERPHAYVFSDAAQDPTKANPFVTFNNTPVLEDIFINGTTFLTVQRGGDYGVLWETIFLATDANHQHAAFGIFVNDVLQNSTRSGIALFAGQQGTVMNGSILSLKRGDAITLRALIPAGSAQNDIPLTNIVQYPGANQMINSASPRIERISNS